MCLKMCLKVLPMTLLSNRGLPEIPLQNWGLPEIALCD